MSDDKKKKLDLLRDREAKLLRDISKDEHPELASKIDELNKIFKKLRALDSEKDRPLTEREQEKKDSLEKRLSKVASDEGVLRKRREKIEKQLDPILNREVIRLDERERVLGKFSVKINNELISFREADLPLENAVPGIRPYLQEVTTFLSEQAQRKDSKSFDDLVDDVSDKQDNPPEEQVIEDVEEIILDHDGIDDRILTDQEISDEINSSF